jgi:uncharacterized ion transporter superfamily protein YfcC
MDSSIKVGVKAFVTAAVIIFLLQIFSGILTNVLPSGSYDRFEKDGRLMIVSGSYTEVEKPDYPFWRWFTAPIEVPFSKGGTVALIIMALIFVISGSFTVMEEAGILSFAVSVLALTFGGRKYLLMGIVIFFFMFMAAFLGVYEGLVPLIVFVVPLALSLGWDSLTGLGMSLLPLAFGFAAAVTNPFTIGIAQKIAELPLFSGAGFRIIFFMVTFVIVYFFVSTYAKKIEKSPEKSDLYQEDIKLRKNISVDQEVHSPQQYRALWWFACAMGAAIVFILITARSASLSSLAFPVMGLLIFIGGIGSAIFVGRKGMHIVKVFCKSFLNIGPGLLLVLMAYSVKHIIDTGMITDTILFRASDYIKGASTMEAAFLVYALTLGMNFFIGSASAKAFLLMPILTPLADLVGITRQTTVLAFDFGDGFSNVLYPTNPLLLIALSFTAVSYLQWLKWTWKLQVLLFGVTAVFLAVAVKIGFGPF